MEKNYLIQYCKNEISELMNSKRQQYYSITLSLTTLKKNNLALYEILKENVSEAINKWNKALRDAQHELLQDHLLLLENNYSCKQLCFVHFNKLPEEDDILNDKFPTKEHHNELIQVSGKIVRRSKVYNYQYKRKYICNKCKEEKIIECTFSENYSFPIETIKCKNLANNCRGTLQPDLINFLPEYFIKYQKYRIQEASCRDIKKSIPKSVMVALENDLVDSCDPGEFVSICGIYELQWLPFGDNKKNDCKLYINAIGIAKDENKILQTNYSENIMGAKKQWEEDVEKFGQLNARNSLINSICTDIFDTYLVKLLLTLSLSSGHINVKNSKITKRGHSHLLLIGDPGVGKSRFLETAAQLSLRSASTTGLGSTNAGLTAACVQENGSYHLEAGALVLADNGVCCIDEFNLLQESDRTSIHEALEQQEINIAKAGILAKLNTRCVVIAAANPKCLTLFQENELNSSNIGIAAPLLSRFDLVMILKNERNLELDRNIALQKLNSVKHKSSWSVERLKSHFLASNEIQPHISEAAKHLILQYYLFCRQDPERDRARTTIRLQDSLNRLTQAHTRLMLRNKVLGCDAILIIKIMEKTYSFGRLLNNGINVHKLEEIGPTVDDIEEILNKLHLTELKNELLKELNELQTGVTAEIIEETQEEKERRLIDFETEFGFRKERLLRDTDANNKSVMIDFENGFVDEPITQKDENGLLNILNSFDNASVNNNSNCMHLASDIEPLIISNTNLVSSPNVKFANNQKKVNDINTDNKFINLNLGDIKRNENLNGTPKSGCSGDLLKLIKKTENFEQDLNLMDPHFFDIEPLTSTTKTSNNKLSPKPICSKSLLNFENENSHNSIFEPIKNKEQLNVQTPNRSENSSNLNELLLEIENDDEFGLNFDYIDKNISSVCKQNNNKNDEQSKNNSHSNDDEFFLNIESIEIKPKDNSVKGKKRNYTSNTDEIQNFEIDLFLNAENVPNKKLKIMDNSTSKPINTNKNRISQALINESEELKKLISISNNIKKPMAGWKTLHSSQQSRETILIEKSKKQSELMKNITENELNELLELDF